jgi:methionine sulfoxide reductase heme-binding subunit
MSEALWALGRASGVVLLALMTITVLLGILTRSGRSILGLPRFGASLLHRNVALVSVVFLAVHVLTLLADPYAQLRLIDLVLPFDGRAAPLWLGLGTVALDLTVAVVVTALLRRRLGRRAFKAVHWLTYLAWPVALIHSIGMGSDARSGWFAALALGSGATIGAATVVRTTESFVEHRRGRLEPER